MAPPRHLSCLLLAVTTTMLALLPALAAASTPLAPTPLSCAVALAPRERCEMLAPAVRLRWSVWGGGNSIITFKLDVDAPASTGWVGLGLNELGSMTGADMYMLSKVAATGAWTLTDRHATGFSKPALDAHDDATLLSASSTALNASVVRVSAAFSRYLAPCDVANDYVISLGARPYVLWAFGAGELSYHGPTDRGAKPLVLLPAPDAAAAATAAEAAFVPASAASANRTTNRTTNTTNTNDVLTLTLPPKTKLPSPGVVTNYVYRFFELPSDTKHHIIGYAPVRGSTYMHHAVAYACNTHGNETLAKRIAAHARAGTVGVSDGAGMPRGIDATWACSSFFAVTAPSTTARLPPQAGLPIGKGYPNTRFLLLEVHLNNPELVDGAVDNGSGMQLLLAPALRRYDAAPITVGAYDFKIPARSPSYAVQTTCAGACTRARLGAAPITLISAFLHMHGAGKAASVRRFRAGRELSPVAQIKSFDYAFQDFLPVVGDAAVLLPGDELMLTCTYNTLSRSNVTTFGPATNDEMCFSFMLGYPAPAPISAAGSSDFTCGSVPSANVSVCASSEDAVFSLLSGDKNVIRSFFKSGELSPLQRPAAATAAPYKAPGACAATRPPSGGVVAGGRRRALV